MKQSCLVIVPVTIKPTPSVSEITAAYLLAEYFGENVEFVERKNQKTPDFKIDGRIKTIKRLILIERSGKVAAIIS